MRFNQLSSNMLLPLLLASLSYFDKHEPKYKALSMVAVFLIPSLPDASYR